MIHTMLGVIFMGIASFFEEVAVSIGKKEVALHHEDSYSMGFINGIVGALMFITIGIISGNLVVQAASFPTLGIRIVLEVAQTYGAIMAITHASRSTFSFIRVWTLPLLLITDLALGYTLGEWQIAGILVITVGFLLLGFKNALGKKGRNWVIFIAINAVITTSLFKYNVTHFNSVAGEQTVILLAKLMFLLCGAIFIKKTNPFKILKTKKHVFQSFVAGISGVLASYAVDFAAASVVMTAKRGFGILASIISGHYYFKEHKFFVKLMALLIVITGIVLLLI